MSNIPAGYNEDGRFVGFTDFAKYPNAFTSRREEETSRGVYYKSSDF